MLHCSADADAEQHSIQADAPQQAAEPEECEEEEYDPYTPLDPHTKGSLPIKPFKKGKKPSARRRPKQTDLPELGKLGVSIYISLARHKDMYGWQWLTDPLMAHNSNTKHRKPTHGRRLAIPKCMLHRVASKQHN